MICEGAARDFSYRIGAMKPEWEFLTKTIYDPEVFWVMVSAVATVLLVILAAIPLWSIAKTRRTEVARRLRDEFWTERTKAIMFLIDHNLLAYDAGVPCFRLRGIGGDPAEEMITQTLGESGVLSIFEVDDKILNPLEEVAAMTFAGSISFEDVYALFGNFIRSTVENEAIRQHIQETRRRQQSANAWVHLERIVPRLDRLDERFSRAAARR